MRKVTPLNYGWLYKEAFEEGDEDHGNRLEGFTAVELPHTNRVLPYNYIDEQDYQFVSCYRRELDLRGEMPGRRFFLEFDGVMTAAQVYCNGKLAGSHKGGYTPFQVELTDYVSLTEKNRVAVRVDAKEDPQIPPFGNVVDYLTYGGIYREVRLCSTEATRIEGMKLSCPDSLAAVKRLDCVLEISSPDGGAAKLTLTLKGDREEAAVSEKQVVLKQGLHSCHISLEGLEGIRLWEAAAPALYEVAASVEKDGGEDGIQERFGFRECRFETDGFTLNGKKQKLIGLNRHQSFPYVGYAMPERVQKRDADILKQTGINVVRCSHYPQSRHFLDRCDELGLMVIEELPGWQYIGGTAWKEQALRDIRDMIRRDFNHPSVILWGVRINESPDDHDFYQKTNALAHEEDPYRQTGGIRYIRGSELLEDVYTYNDFTYDGGDKVLLSRRESMGTDSRAPVLVTENMGHMYPTKQFDHEERLTEHALRHLRIMDETFGRKDLAGEISWCAFDYNTHGCFGSGDKICYHGVYDMFRNPKYAAAAYASQKDPADGIVLEPLTRGARGEKDGGGLVPFFICTNCDYVRVYRNGKWVDDFYPETKSFPHLPHPPVRVGHLIEKDTDFGIPGEEGERLRGFLEQKLSKGKLLKLEKEETDYLTDLADRFGLSPQTLYAAVVKTAGGWGDRENNFRLEGWLNGEKVCEHSIGEGKSMAGITVEPDDEVLFCGGETYDATRIAVRAVDTLGEPEPFTRECVQIVLTGPAKLIGPDRFPLQGGGSAFWIRTTGTAGKVTILAKGVYAQAGCEVEVKEVKSSGAG